MLAYLDMFKNDYHLQPTKTQVLAALISIPWSIKFFFGMLADSVPIYKSRRRSYLIIMALIQIICMSLLAFERIESETIVAFILFMTIMSIAFNDVIVNALMVTEAKKDPENGSQELQTFAWASLSFAMMIGSVIAALETQYLNP